MVRSLLAGICAAALLVGFVPPAVGAPPASLILSDVSHTLDGNALIVTGLIENRGTATAGIVVDALGYSAQGDEVVAGSDGIPWRVPSGGVERFSIRLLVTDRLIRDYVVRVAYARPPYTAVAAVRRGVDLGLYRALILSMVRVQADLIDGWLVVRSRTERLPVSQITVEVSVLVPFRKTVIIETVTLTVTADGTATAFLGHSLAALVSIRITDVLLRTAWSD